MGRGTRDWELGTSLIVIRVCVIRYSETMVCAIICLSVSRCDSAHD